jgi:hypothetical protein
MSVLSVGFAAVGLVMLLAGDAEAKLWGGASVLMFGGGAVVLAMSVRRPGRFSLTPVGLLVESAVGRAFAPWDQIVSVGRTHIQRQDMLTVDVADISRIETSPRLSWLKRLNQSMGMPDLAFPTSLLGERADALERAIGHYIDHPDARSRVGTPAELERLLGNPAAQGNHGALRAQQARKPAGESAPSTAARALLWLGGAVGLLFTVAGALGGSDPGRETSHLLGVLVFGTTSVAALAAAWLLPRWRRAGRGFGLFAVAGGIFIGWLLTQSSRSGLGAVLIGIAIVAACAFVGWQLFRWWRGDSTSDRAAA